MKLPKKLLTSSLVFLVVGSTSAYCSPLQRGNIKLVPSSPVTDLLSQSLFAMQDSQDLSSAGNDAAKQGLWKEAATEYQKALVAWKDNTVALYGLARCCQASGDMAGELGYYRSAIYSTNPADKGFRETKTKPLMNFALLLNQVGQTDEAIFVYNHTVYALDYQGSNDNNGKPYLKVLLPEIVAANPTSDQLQYTPERLQALADTALAKEETGFGSNKEAVAHMQEAVKLFPDSPVTNYYLGEIQSRAGGNAEAKAAYQRAAKLGNARTVAAAKERLSVMR